MATDLIKQALTSHYHQTYAKEWKRRTKTNLGGLIERAFDHPLHGRVMTYEDQNGVITVGNRPDTVLTATEPVAEPVVQPIFEKPSSLQTVQNDLYSITLPTVDVPFQIGDTISVPKGTPVYKIGYSNLHDRKIASKATKAKISDILDYNCLDQYWVMLATLEEQTRIEEIMRRVGVSAEYKWVISHATECSMWCQSSNPELTNALYDLKQAITERFQNGFSLVCWGNKAVFYGHATSSNERVVPKEKINIRTLMVPNSTWQFTQDVDFTLEVENPKIWNLVAKRDSINRSPNHTTMVNGTMVVRIGGGRNDTPQELATRKSIQDEITHLKNTEPFVRIPAGRVSAGTVIEITGKLTPSSGLGGRNNGLATPVRIISGDAILPKVDYYYDGSCLPYNQIVSIIEPLDIPKTLVYVLRDNTTGLWFGGWDKNDKPRMVERFSSSKKYVNQAAVKASIRDFTGYNDGLDETGPYYSHRSKKIDLPTTWEMVSVDKTTSQIEQVIEIQDWFKGLMRLRNLTANHGSVVRALYKKCEGLPDMTNIILFTNVDPEYNEAYPWEDDSHDKTKDIRKLVKDHVGKSYTDKSPTMYGVACSYDEAIMLYMSASEYNVKMFDMKNLEEIIPK